MPQDALTLASRERVCIESSTLKSANWEGETLVLEFHNGTLIAYHDFPMSAFEAFAQSVSKGKYFNTEIRGKYQGEKLTGTCPVCTMRPQVIGATCKACGEGIVRAEELKRKP